jgi:2-haloacid dehalogenase
LWPKGRGGSSPLFRTFSSLGFVEFLAIIFQSSNIMIRALVFDAYGTLFDPLSVREECERLFPGKGAQLSLLWRVKQLEYTWLRSLMNRYEDFWRVTEDALRFSCANLGLPCGDAQRDALMQEYLRLKAYPETRGALRSLRGIPLLILSNGSPKMLKAVVQNAGFARTFAAVLSVDAVKIYKPSPQVYELAVKETGFDKGSIGFVSSNGWDIAGAASFGFQTFWINRAGATTEELSVRPSAILKSLAELPALVGPAS